MVKAMFPRGAGKKNRSCGRWCSRNEQGHELLPDVEAASTNLNAAVQKSLPEAVAAASQTGVGSGVGKMTVGAKVKVGVAVLVLVGVLVGTVGVGVGVRLFVGVALAVGMPQGTWSRPAPT